MNDGIFFYMAAWCGWIFFTFIHEKNKNRLKWSLCLLFIIFLSGHSFTSGKVTVGFSSAGFLLLSMIGLSTRRFFDMLRLVMFGFIIMMLFVLVHAYFLYDPAMLIAPRFVMAGLFAAFVSMIVARTEREALLVLVIGLVLGDSLFQYVILPVKGTMEIGSKEVLDLGAVSFSSVYICSRLSYWMKSANKHKPSRKISLRR